jgi:hypothetical protein
MTHLAAWFGQFVGALSVCAAMWLTAFNYRHEKTPMVYAVMFYVIGAVMLLMNLDALFGTRVVSGARVVAAFIVLISEVVIMRHVIQTYDIGGIVHG